MRNGASALFHALNREKRSIALNLRDTQERESLARLIIERADVVIQNLRPDSVEVLGIGAADLTLRKPSLIYCNLSAFGGVGPMGSSPGYDPPHAGIRRDHECYRGVRNRARVGEDRACLRLAC